MWVNAYGFWIYHHGKRDGITILVHRNWPRSVSKEEAELDEWKKQQ